ncbi:MAG: hydrogenase maturation protease [Nitrosomonas sp.]|nr:hydrogenase maturation protease [Nitrosomonas sp.]
MRNALSETRCGTGNGLRLIIGIGNRHRGDDAIGCILAERLQTQLDLEYRIITHDGEPASLMAQWAGCDEVILLDAVRSGRQPGTLIKLDLVNERLPQTFLHCSTHAFGITEAVELSRAMGTLPKKLVFYGIEAQTFDSGAPVSDTIAQQLDTMFTTIVRDLHDNHYENQGAPPMHEFSLMADLLRKIEHVAQEAGGQKKIAITAIRVKLGALSHIGAAHFREHFEIAIKGTVAEGARLDVEELTDTNDPNAQEIILDSIEVRNRDDACTH